MTTYERGKLYEISIIDFKLDPDQPRKVIDPDALAELTASIKTHGILQPLLFRQGDQGWLYIVSGERRYRAAKELGLLTLPAMLVEGNHAEIALVENPSARISPPWKRRRPSSASRTTSNTPTSS